MPTHGPARQEGRGGVERRATSRQTDWKGGEREEGKGGGREEGDLVADRLEAESQEVHTGQRV